jgi:hypothetical protein
MTLVARGLRLDGETWERFTVAGSMGGAALIVIGAYAVLAFDRFGMQGLAAPRASARLILIGVYGWLWLAAAGWILGRLALKARARFGLLFRLYGYAHIPLLAVGLTIQVISIGLRVLGPALVVTIAAMLLWMPAMLLAAARQACDAESRRALWVVVGPYLVWLVVLGLTVGRQVRHLL